MLFHQSEIMYTDHDLPHIVQWEENKFAVFVGFMLRIYPKK